MRIFGILSRGEIPQGGGRGRREGYFGVVGRFGGEVVDGREKIFGVRGEERRGEGDSWGWVSIWLVFFFFLSRLC